MQQAIAAENAITKNEKFKGNRIRFVALLKKIFEIADNSKCNSSVI